MGLDITHGCWHGSYGSFMRFRQTLAREIGINLDKYEGYINSGRTKGVKGKDLRTIKHDIYPLLDHSDCDGELSIDEAKRIVKGLDNILDNYSSKNRLEDIGFIRDVVLFRNGCRKAIKKNQIIKFR